MGEAFKREFRVLWGLEYPLIISACQGRILSSDTASPQGNNCEATRAVLQTLSYGSFILPNGNGFWKLTHRDAVKDRRKQQCLKAELLLFFPFHAGVQWDSCVPVLQGHQGPLLMVEIMFFLCSAQALMWWVLGLCTKCKLDKLTKGTR